MSKHSTPVERLPRPSETEARPAPARREPRIPSEAQAKRDFDRNAGRVNAGETYAAHRR